MKCRRCCELPCVCAAYQSQDETPPETVSAVQRFTAHALHRVIRDSELGAAIGRDYEVAVVAVDLRTRPPARGYSAAFREGADPISHATDLLAHSLAMLARLNPDRRAEIVDAVRRALART